jgi:hypothetical protein
METMAIELMPMCRMSAAKLEYDRRERVPKRRFDHPGVLLVMAGESQPVQTGRKFHSGLRRKG